MSSRELESWMWAEACNMLDRANRLHRQFFRPSEAHSQRVAWEPPVDVYETQSDVTIMVALPGVAPKHIKIILQDGNLIIGGQRHLPVDADTEIHRLEIPYGRFERLIELPLGHFELGGRKFLNGCLLVSLQRI